LCFGNLLVPNAANRLEANAAFGCGGRRCTAAGGGVGDGHRGGERFNLLLLPVLLLLRRRRRRLEKFKIEFEILKFSD